MRPSDPGRQKIRILFLPHADARNLNAQSLNLREIAPRLDAEQFELTLLYTQEPDPRVVGCPHIKLLHLPQRLKTLRLLKEMFSGYDLIAYMDYSPASYLFLHAPRWMCGHARSIMHVEALPFIDGGTALFRFLYAGTVSKCDFYTGISERVGKDFEQVMHRKISHILPVGVNTQLFSPETHPVDRPVTVLFAGTLMKSKRPLAVLTAATRFPKVKFRIIGADRHGYERVVRQKIAELGVVNVTLEGAKPQEEIARAMRESDIFLLPSHTEGLPKVTLEAAASGLPCVIFHDYEAPSVVNGHTGFQVSTDEEMMNKLALLIHDAEMRRGMGDAARKHAENFTWDFVASLWQEAYRKIAYTQPLDCTQR